MGTIVSNMYDEIKLHGSWEAYVEFRDIDSKKVETLPDQGDIPYFPDPEVVDNTGSLHFDPHNEEVKGILAMMHSEFARNIKL